MDVKAVEKKPHMGRRRLVLWLVSAGFIGVGLFVMADQSLVGGLLQPFLGSAPSAGAGGVNPLMPYGDGSYIIYAIGFGILMSGVGLARSNFHSGLARFASGGSDMGGMGFSAQAMQNLMATSMARMNAPVAPPAQVVKVKCAKCGSLEEQDAAFCHKCGAAM